MGYDIIKISLKGKSPDFAEGFLEGIKTFAWWKDGEQFVGSVGIPLKDVEESIKEVTEA